MAKYVVVMVDHVTGDRQIQDDEYDSFDSYEAAQDYANECAGNFSTGYDVMSLMGDWDDDDITDPNDVDFVVEEF